MTISQIPRTTDELDRLVESGELSQAAARVINCVNHFNGFSLDNHGDELRRFIARGVDNPATILDPKVSDCGMFALAVYAAIEIKHRLLKEKYVLQMAIAWLTTIAHDLNAVRHPQKDGPPKPGSLMIYYTHGENDNHAEFCLTDCVLMHDDHYWLAYHGGGGRHHCGIGVTQSDVKWNFGRPLQEWYDIDALANAPERKQLILARVHEQADVDETAEAPPVEDADRTDDDETLK